MPQDDESFLDAVLQPADEVACGSAVPKKRRRRGRWHKSGR